MSRRVVRTRSGLRSPNTWAWAAALAFPAVVLSHELGHYVTARALGLSGVRLHFMGVSVPALEAFWIEHARTGASPATAGISTVHVLAPIAAGLAITYFTIMGCAVLAMGGHHHPVIVMMGLVAPLRFYFSLGVVWAWLRGKPIPLTSEDESRLAAVTHTPEGLWVVTGIVLSLIASAWIIGAVRREAPRGALLLGTAGLVLGILLYGGAIGPILLP